MNNPYRAPLSSAVHVAPASGTQLGGGSSEGQHASGGLMGYLGLVGTTTSRKLLVWTWLLFIAVFAFTNWLFNDHGSSTRPEDGQTIGGLSTTGGLLRDYARGAEPERD
ncbi:hypothetical protein [Tautonia sociabilis]|uniref:Uncharacterized protein n=1 Tax=Tautonia sociabilis TaxID=2080755 RepID=A0A432MIM3_9BACT|nr:hypothetical protein [Tautonia sociabilis]RUL87006.1 hypothetical protein TsocGM_14510 [Tautonia sociabilis]